MKITKITAGTKNWSPQSPDDERTSMLLALAQANRIVEIDGQPAEICIEVLSDDSKTFRARVPVERLSELDEVFNRGTIPREFRQILDTLKVSERAPELPRLPGMSWVHMGIKEDGELLGHVTACVIPSRNVANCITVAFAFCKAADNFSRRIGRVMSRSRLDLKYTLDLVEGSDRYSAVRSFLLSVAAGRKPLNLVNEDYNYVFPSWMDPKRSRRGDVPQDVVEFLEELKTARGVDYVFKRRAEELLKKDRTPEYETWPIRE